MRIAGIQKNSLIDFPGVPACVIFTAGCNMDCFYCHNRNLIEGSPELLDTEEVLSFLKKRKGLLEGVVISGGEPTLQPDLADFMKKVKALGFLLKLDTNGGSPDILEKLLHLTDYIAMDIKAQDGMYGSVCGGNAPDVRRSLDILLKSGVSFEVRTTLYPGMTEEDLTVLLASYPRLPGWRLNIFRMPEIFKGRDRERLYEKALTEADINRLMPRLKKHQNITGYGM